MTRHVESATGRRCATIGAARPARPLCVRFPGGRALLLPPGPIVRRLFAAALPIWAAMVVPAGAAFAETVWARWAGAWEVVLDRQADGATCLWSTYDARPPDHARRLTFANNRQGEVVVIVSDRREPLHRMAGGSGPGGRLMLGGRLYDIEIGAGIPLPGLPGGMLVGRLSGERTDRFARVFGEHDGEEARLRLPGGWSWRLPLRGAAQAASEVASCLAETEPQGHIR